MTRIAKIHTDSLAEEIGLQIGDRIVSINGTGIQDILDYQMLITDEYVEVEVETKTGESLIFEIEKDEHEQLGVEWETPTIDKIKLCHNKCIFCFVDQIPSNMRKTLQIRDDDYRLSFLQGNYITLTNVTDDDLHRIARMRLSPINISVHTTNLDLREQMLNNKKAKNLLKQIQFLADHDITMHTQIVLCPTYNDGQELQRTISDLIQYFPYIRSVSVVPVGLTGHRDLLHTMRQVTKQEAIDALKIIEAWQEKNIKEFGSAIVYGADELYVQSEQEVPEAIFYDGFEQLENGVGLIRLFLDEIYYYCKDLSEISPSRKFLILTGVSAEKTIRQALQIVMEKTSLEIKCHVIPNRFYGTQVTVTGLITGSDIINEWEQSKLSKLSGIYDEIILPDIMLKENEDIFLDNLTLEQVEVAIGRKLTVVNASGKGLVEGITKRILETYHPNQRAEEYQLRTQRYERCDFFA